MPHLLIAGFGYTASYIADYCLQHGWQVTALSRSQQSKYTATGSAIEVLQYKKEQVQDILPNISHVLITAPPTPVISDPLSNLLGSDLEESLAQLQWIGYLSSTGVYGDYAGAWVDESAICKPVGEMATRRWQAEQIWRNLLDNHVLPIHIFRLAGIYGPGQNVLLRILAGKAHTIVKAGQFFSRIHVQDLAMTIWLAMYKNIPKGIYNIADDLPAPSHEVEQFAAKLLNYQPLPEIPYDPKLLSTDANAFYQANKRVSNVKIKTTLNIKWLYPTYIEGLQALYQNVKL
jgi:nucleoside-diphosphate-sugar epimerase